jgi:hypothetical protein
MGSHNKGNGAAFQWICDNANHQGEECLIWPFSRPTGYGSFGHLGKQYRAHRFMCEMANGPAPSAEHQASHSCGNGRNGCVNPRHLQWKTNGENQLDRRQHGTANRQGPRGRLTAEQVAEIRQLKDTMSQPQFARMFGVTHSTIQYCLRPKIHKRRRPTRLSSNAEYFEIADLRSEEAILTTSRGRVFRLKIDANSLPSIEPAGTDAP